MNITMATSPPFCPNGWVPPPESGKDPIPPPDDELGGQTCKGKVPCYFPNTPLITGTTLLFDLDADPYEFHDVSSAHPDVASELFAQLQACNATAVVQQHYKADPDALDG